MQTPSAPEWNESQFDRLGGIVPIVGERLVPFEADEIEAIERAIGAQLPVQYRSFIGRFGGVSFGELVAYQPDQTFPRTISRRNQGLFSALFCSSRQRETLSLKRRISDNCHRIPSSLIPIGDDGGAGFISRGVAGDARGKVYYWSRQLEPSEDENPSGVPGWDNIFLIDGSFAGFLQRLFVVEDLPS